VHCVALDDVFVGLDRDRGQGWRLLEIQGALLDRHFDEAIRICEKRHASHLARVVKVGVQQLYSRRVSVSFTDITSLVDCG